MDEITQVINLDLRQNNSTEYTRIDLQQLKDYLHHKIPDHLTANNFSAAIHTDHYLLTELDNAISIDGNKLTFNIPQMLEKCFVSRLSDEKKKINNKLIKAAKLALHEFLMMILKQTIKTRLANDKAESFLDKFRITATNEYHFFVKDTEYFVEFKEYSSALLALPKKDNWRRRKSIKNIHSIKKHLSRQLQKIKQELAGYPDHIKNTLIKLLETFEKKLAKLDKTTANSFKLIPQAFLIELEQQIKTLEKEFKQLLKMAIKLSDKDILRLEHMALDLAENNELNNLLDNLDVAHLLAKDINETLTQNITEDHTISVKVKDKEAVSFKKNNEALIETSEPGSAADDLHYTQIKSRKSADQNIFTKWLNDLKLRMQGNKHINIKIGETDINDIADVILSQEEKEQQNKPKTIL